MKPCVERRKFKWKQRWEPLTLFTWKPFLPRRSTSLELHSATVQLLILVPIVTVAKTECPHCCVLGPMLHNYITWDSGPQTGLCLLWHFRESWLLFSVQFPQKRLPDLKNISGERRQSVTTGLNYCTKIYLEGSL